MIAMEDVLNNPELSGGAIATLVILMVWSLIWKGIALWKSSRLSHKKWFVALLVINTVGILEILYIFFIANKYSVETIDTETAESEVVKDSSDTEIETEE